MSLYEQILALRAIRSFRDEALSYEDLAAILEAARWTGSSKNLQSWAFIVVRDPKQRERLAACGDFTDPIRNAPATLALMTVFAKSSADAYAGPSVIALQSNSEIVCALENIVPETIPAGSSS